MMREEFKISKESVDKLEIHKEPMDKLLERINIEGYESPIDIVLGQMRMDQENGIYRAVCEQGIFVDKDELIKALRYDRGQYEKGYLNGYRAKSSEVAREIIIDIINPIWEAYAKSESPRTTLLAAVICKSIVEKLKKKYTEGGE